MKLSKKELQEQLAELEQDYQAVVRAYDQKCHELSNQTKTNESPPRQRTYAAALCIDFWPLSDWRRLSFHRFRTGRYFQLCIGPFRFDFYDG